MKTKILLIVALGLLTSLFQTVSAQDSTLVTEFKTFVEAVEADGNNYTKEQWDEANKTFDALGKKFKEQKDSLTREEQNTIHDLTGRYKAAVTNSGVDSAVKGMTKTYNSVANATTDAFNETKAFFNGIFKKKDADSTKTKDGSTDKK